MTMDYFFFFSSRRRHTRCIRDWSSDVCSSDLLRLELLVDAELPGVDDAHRHVGADGVIEKRSVHRLAHGVVAAERERKIRRSEERRVGKECRSRWSPDHLKKKK